MNRVLIVGSSGVIGSAAVTEFSRQCGVEVIALSRRPPDISADVAFTHLAVDLNSPGECRRAIAQAGPIDHVVYAAVAEAPGLVSGWTDVSLMERNLLMLRNIVEPVAAAGALRHISLMQGTKAYGFHLHRIDIPAHEHDARDPHLNFYWLHEDYIRKKAAAEGWSWSIFRPQIVLGGATGVVMNPVPVIGVLAALAHEQNEPFGFPGRHTLVFEAVDARLLARALVWATKAKAANGQIFNLTNGDIFVPKYLWPKIARMVGLPPASSRPVDLAAQLNGKQVVWDRVIARHGLRRTRLDSLLGESLSYLQLMLGNEFERPPQPVLVSTIKIRKAGFGDCMDTEDTFRYWLGELVQNRTLPPMGELRLREDSGDQPAGPRP